MSFLILDIECLSGIENQPIVKELTVLESYQSKVDKKLIHVTWTYQFTSPYSEYQVPKGIRKRNSWVVSPIGLHNITNGDTSWEKFSGIVSLACENYEYI